MKITLNVRKTNKYLSHTNKNIITKYGFTKTKNIAYVLKLTNKGIPYFLTTGPYSMFNLWVLK